MASRTVSAPVAQIPNALTVGRLVAIPVFAALILDAQDGYSWAAALVFAGASITDQVDGFLARRWHVESAFGKIADPLADRLLIDVAVVLLWHAGRLPWAAFLIPARDLVTIALTPIALGRGYRFEVNLLGKIATWFLMASLSLAMVVHHRWPLYLFWIGFAFALVALAQYVLKAQHELAEARGDRPATGKPDMPDTEEFSSRG